jgi:hypothetical protein
MSAVMNSVAIDRDPLCGIADVEAAGRDVTSSLASALFERPRRSLAGARQRIAELDAGIKAFMDAKPYANLAEPNRTTGEIEHKIKFTRRIPREIEDAAIDAIDGLRSALDQVGHACAVAAGTSLPRSACFPISRDRAQIDGVIARRCQDLPHEIASAMKGLSPWGGGNDLIVALDELFGVNKYRLLTPMGMNAGPTDLENSIQSGPGRIRFPRWDRVKNEIVYARARAGAPVERGFQASLFISFGEVPFVAHQPPVHILNSMASEVETALAAIEAEARRIALF